MANALEITGLEKTYKGGTKALKGVSLNIKEGEIFALLGANGAGKTTIIGILTGLVTKTGGTAKVFGVDIEKEPEKARSLIGVVPQEMNFSIFETVLNIVVDAAGYYGVPRKVAMERAEKILKELSLWDKRNAQSKTLSGGMKRRLLIARALIHEPKLLLLDEPSAGVDVELRRSMWEFVQKLNANGTTIMLTTHYLEEAEKLCKDVVILKEGTVVKAGEIKSLMAEVGSNTLEDFYMHVTNGAK